MHFSIPDTQELYAESTGTTYTGYSIYINGAYHCCLRYKQLHALHEQLRRRCGSASALPVFPPKKLLPLTISQLEARRAALELYLQLVGQDVHVARLEHFQNFLLSAQLETAAAEAEVDSALGDFGGTGDATANLEVVLMNGYQLQVACRVTDNASALLRQVGVRLQLPTSLLGYFGLFLLRKELKDTLVLLRRLFDFEAPFLSRLCARPCQIALRKCYWNPALDARLLRDPIALNLLFIQTLSDVEREWIIAPPAVHQKLRNLQEHGLKREYLEIARTLPLYGCLQFSAVLVDYPEQETSALISIGNSELSVRTAKGAKIYETKFRVTRMRCWRVTAALHPSTAPYVAVDGSPPQNVAQLPQLSFEYLMSKQTLRWITITSPQAMLMSVCLQSMVDELLSSQNETEMEVAGASDKRNGCTTTTNVSSSSSTHSFGHEQQQQMSPSTSTPTSSTSTSTTSTSSSTSSPTAPVKFLAQRRHPKQNSKISSNSYAAVFFRNAQQESTESSVHNEAFEGIGDDDL